MTKGAIGRVVFGVWLGCFTAVAAQLPPDVLVDKHLLQAKMLSEDKDHKGALKAMDRIVALQKEHDLTLPEEFPFHYAQTALAAGSAQAAIDSVNQYLTATGREGKYYREALDLLVKAERKLRELAVDQAGSGTAEPDCRQWATKTYFRAATVEGVTACLEAGADPTAQNDLKWTPLHNAAFNKNPAVFEALLQGGADPNAPDKWQATPLHYAVLNKDPAVIETLLQGGADPNARNDEQKTPLDVATKNKNEATRQVLLAAGRGAGSALFAAGNAGVTAGGGPCQVPGYPRPADVTNLGLRWCPASVNFQVRSFALHAARAQCAIATGGSLTPEQIEARRREIRAACDRLAALGQGNCQCPPGLGQ